MSKFGVPVSILVFGFAFFFLWKFFHPAALSKPSEVATSTTSIGVPVAALPAAKTPSILNDQWRVLGWFNVGSVFVVALKGQGGVIRYLHSPSTYQLNGNDLSVLLPEGGFATSYSGNFDAVQRGL